MLRVRKGRIDAGLVLSMVAAVAVLVAIGVSISRPTLAQRDSRVIDALNRGAALMGQFEFAAAESAFREAREIDAGDDAAQFNVAIAVLNQSELGSQERAQLLFQKILKSDPLNGRAQYGLGLAHAFLGNSNEATIAFGAACRGYPNDAFAHFYLGQALETSDGWVNAAVSYERAIALDPLLRSAVLGLARCQARLGNAESSGALFKRFEDLAANGRAHLAEFKYTRMGPLALVEIPNLPQPLSMPKGDAFRPVERMQDGAGGAITQSAAMRILPVELDADGSTDCVAVSELESIVWRGSPDGSFNEILDHPLRALVGVAAFGDVNGDGLLDAISLGENQVRLFVQNPLGVWSERGDSCGITPPAGKVHDMVLVDIDCDADLDLLATDGSLQQWMNKGDGQFMDLPGRSGILSSMQGLRSIGLVDCDGDADTDVVLINESGSSELWINEGLWAWSKSVDWSESVSGSVIACAFFVHPDSGGTCAALIENVATGKSVVVVRSFANLAAALWRSPLGHAARIAAMDVDGCGRPSILVEHEKSAADPSFLEIMSCNGASIQKLPSIEHASLLVNRDDKGPSLIGWSPTGDPSSWTLCTARQGIGRLPFASISLSGRVDLSQSMRTNTNGIGTAWSARLGSTWSEGVSLRHDSGPGQGAQPEAIGLCGLPAADFMQLEWSDGLIQTELSITPGWRAIVETQRQVSSCPVIFGWNGESFEFVTDCLGVGGVGYLIGIETSDAGLNALYSVPTPRESVALPKRCVVEREGLIEIRLTEPMEESCALDSARLIAWDLPAGWHLALDERLAIEGPAASGDPIFWRKELTVSSARVEGYRESTAVLQLADGSAAVGPPAHSNFIGLLSKPLTVECTFSGPIDALPGTPVLLMDGWVEYPYCQTNFAMWQAGMTPQPPSIEALDPATGSWTMVQSHYGYPAGMPRQAAFPLDASSIPSGCNTLRISTTVELFIDALRVVGQEACPESSLTLCELREAEVAVCGFPRRTTLAQKRPYYDYADRTPLDDCQVQSGSYTRVGSCTELIETVDDASAVFGPGEELQLRFVPPLPARGGLHREWVLQLNGWCKDMDRFTGNGKKLEPLPSRRGDGPSSAARELMSRFNSRVLGE
ncbi:MAG: FG-GAP-like repeat-containing protein [Planctomycetota bacterium]|nr:FG-GAP-like repeat-containing protein [Planctomycetota bacterium]